MASTNKFGLSRNIPENIKRQIRREAGFGCVVCGNAIFQYEHIDPVFSESREHDPTRMTLLCAACHDRVTRGFLSKSSVLRAKKNPETKKRGYSFGMFDLCRVPPIVKLGAIVARNSRSIISAGGQSLLQVKPPEETGAPFRLCARFPSSNGAEAMIIEDNEWKAGVQNWDVDVVGRTVTIRERHRRIVLQITTTPPRLFEITRAEIKFAKAALKVFDGSYELTNGDGSSIRNVPMERIGVYEHPNLISFEKNGTLVVEEGDPNGVSFMWTRTDANYFPLHLDFAWAAINPCANCPCNSGMKFSSCHGRFLRTYNSS